MMDARLSEILDFLNDRKMRAHYGAVAGVLDVTPRSVGTMLGEHSPRASWVVAKESNMPTDYEAEDQHPELQRTSLIIQTPGALSRGMQSWRG
jgi:hypothetical protein